MDSHAQRIHDLRTVHADFKAVLRLLRSGYRLEGEEAIAVFAQLEKSLGLLEAEIRTAEKSRPASS